MKGDKSIKKRRKLMNGGLPTVNNTLGVTAFYVSPYQPVCQTIFTNKAKLIVDNDVDFNADFDKGV